MDVQAPFTSEQVESLNGFQQSSYMHPFTCGNDECRHVNSTFRGTTVLEATPDGWRCPNCDYRQNWAHDFMADGSWRKHAELIDSFFRGN